MEFEPGSRAEVKSMVVDILAQYEQEVGQVRGWRYEDIAERILSFLDDIGYDAGPELFAAPTRKGLDCE